MFRVKNIKPPPDIREFVKDAGEQKAEVEPVGLITKARRLKDELRGWARAGFPQVTRETRQKRKAICYACPHWNPEGNIGLGACRKCGCSRAKLYLATAKCPIGKWSAEELQR